MKRKALLGMMVCVLVVSIPIPAIALGEGNGLENRPNIHAADIDVEDVCARYGIGKVLDPEFEGEHEITAYFDTPDNIIEDWKLYEDMTPGLNPDWITYKKNSFYYIYEEKRIVQDGPGYIFINGEPNVTLYGKELGSPFIMLESTLVSNGWKLEHIANEVKMKDPQGSFENYQPYWYKKNVWSEDTWLLVYCDEANNVKFWYMTNEGMATQDEAVPQHYLHYIVKDAGH